MYINRVLEGKIRNYLDSKEIIGVIGPRQSGKTTLLKRIYGGLDNAEYISFDDREKLELFVQDIKSFAELYVKNKKYLFLDEFQYASEGGKNLKFLYDEYPTKIFISGSSASELSVQSIKYLVGRIFLFNLYPLSFEEYLSFKDEALYRIYLKNIPSQPIIEKINKHYEEFITYGGYPRVVTSKNSEEKKEVLKNIYNTYFLREIKEILQLPEDFKLSKLIKFLALQTGSVINYNELSSGTGFSYHDLQKNLNILKKTFVCVESRPYYTNKRKELVKAPKMFFIDSGFRNTVLGNYQALDSRVDKGSVNENFIASELAKTDTEIKYWRTKAGAEVDFVIESAGNITPIESKSAYSEEKISRSLRNFIEQYKPKKAYLLSPKTIDKKKAGETDVLFTPTAYIGKVKRDLAQ